MQMFVVAKQLYPIERMNEFEIASISMSYHTRSIYNRYAYVRTRKIHVTNTTLL